MRLLFHIIPILLIVISGCSSKKNNNSVNTIPRISLDLNDQKQSIPFSEIFKDSKFVKLQTSEDALLGNVKRVYLLNDTIFISSSTSILLFDMAGVFLGQIKKQGNGPSEYTKISDFILDKNNKIIEIFDRAQKKILLFDFKGNFIDEKKINRWAQLYTMLDDDYRVMYSTEIEGNYNYKLRIIRKMQEVEHSLEIDCKRDKYLHIIATTNFSPYNGSILFAEWFNDTVYSITKNEVSRKYVFEINKSYRIPTSFYNKNYNYIFEFFNDLKKTNYAYGIDNFIETDNSLFLRYFKCFPDKNKPINIFYNKQTKTPFLFHTLYDDINFKGINLSFNEYNLFKQNDETIIVFIPADEFLEYMNQAIEISKKSKDLNISKQLYNIYNSTKINDNPIICLLKLR